MTDRKEGLLETQDEPMQSTESSAASLSLEHLEPGILRTVAANSEPSQPRTIESLDMNYLDSFLIEGASDATAEPSLEIVEQPKQKELRFRYECEGRSAGSLLGVRSNNDRKIYPTVKIKNYKGKAKIVASLVTRQPPHHPHPNGLVGKLCKNGVCTVIVENNQKMTVSFPNLGIQCAKKKDIPAALEDRRKLGVDPFNLLASRADGLVPNNDYEMNVVCLCFQAFLPDPHHPNQLTRALPPQVTVPIYDKKGASLNISRVDRNNGTVNGGDEMFILCDKVQKDDIEVIFFHDDWEASATFGPSDIHRQVAIVCRTPPYRDRTVQRSVTVHFKLRRKSDKETSDPVEFIYKPIDLDEDGIEAKRRKKSPHFSKFIRENTPVKVEQIHPCENMLMQQQQQQQQQQQHAACNIATTSGDQGVKQMLRYKIQNNSKAPLITPTGPSFDIKTPPREFVRAVRSCPKVATFSQASSTYSFSDGSNMASGTVWQRAPAATATTGAPFTFQQPVLTNSNPPVAFQGVSESAMGNPIPNQPPPGMVPAPEFGNNSAAEGCTNEAISAETNNLIQQLMNNDIVTEEQIASLLIEDETVLQGFQPSDTSMEELTLLENFDPRTLEIGNGIPDEMPADPGMVRNDIMLENPHDSLSIPYSHSVELENEPHA